MNSILYPSGSSTKAITVVPCFIEYGFADDVSALPLHTFAGFVGIVHFNRDVSVGVAQVVSFRIPVVRQFQNRAVGFIAVTDEGKGKSALRDNLFGGAVSYPKRFGRNRGIFRDCPRGA